MKKNAQIKNSERVNIMRKLLLPFFLALSVNVNAATSLKQFDMSKFYGSWSWETPANCIETYTFKNNGILQIKSGDEITNSIYQITPQEVPKLLTKLTFTTIKDNGGNDCAGSTNDSIGESVDMYIGISPDGKEMLNCGSAEGDDCWHLKRIEEKTDQ